MTDRVVEIDLSIVESGSYSDRYAGCLTYSWCDDGATITGCYEDQPIYFNDSNEILSSGLQLMDEVVWVVDQCRNKKHIK